MTKIVRRHAAGFTLIELMFAVAIAAILATIAVQAYGSYVVSSKLSESFAMLGDYRLKMEQFKQDNRTYANPLNVNACGVSLPVANKYFDFGCAIAASGAHSRPPPRTKPAWAWAMPQPTATASIRTAYKIHRHSPARPAQAASGRTSEVAEMCLTCTPAQQISIAYPAGVVNPNGARTP